MVWVAFSSAEEEMKNEGKKGSYSGAEKACILWPWWGAPHPQAQAQGRILSAHLEMVLVSTGAPHLPVLMEAHAPYPGSLPSSPQLYFWGIPDLSLSPYKTQVRDTARLY